MQTGRVALCVLTGKSRDVHLQDSLPLFIVVTEDPITAILHQYQTISSTLGWEEQTSTAENCINTSCLKLAQKAAVRSSNETRSRLSSPPELPQHNSCHLIVLGATRGPSGRPAQVRGRKAKACRAVLCMLRTSCHASLNLQLLCPHVLGVSYLPSLHWAATIG